MICSDNLSKFALLGLRAAMISWLCRRQTRRAFSFAERPGNWGQSEHMVDRVIEETEVNRQRVETKVKQWVAANLSGELEEGRQEKGGPETLIYRSKTVLMASIESSKIRCTQNSMENRQRTETGTERNTKKKIFHPTLRAGIEKGEAIGVLNVDISRTPRR